MEAYSLVGLMHKQQLFEFTREAHVEATVQSILRQVIKGLCEVVRSGTGVGPP